MCNHSSWLELESKTINQSDILPGLGAKQPKAVAGCIFALKEVIR